MFSAGVIRHFAASARQMSADFRLWATINQLAPREFFVSVSAVPAARDGDGATILETDIATSRERAEALSADMLLRVGKLIRERGDRVVDVEGG